MNGRVLVFGLVALLALAVGFDAWWQLNIGAPVPSALSGLPPTVQGSTGLPVQPRIAQGAEYERCLAMVPGDPAGAYALADAWEATGGGDGATHCNAAAQLALGNTEAGAELLEKLAKGSKAAPLARAFVFGQATQAWLMAGDAARAYGAATMALALAPDDIDLLIDRSIAAATMARYLDAIDDLNLALDRDPRRTDALVFRAAAWRHEGQLALANDDVTRAVAIDPDFPEAMLERGILRQRRGNLDGARTDWQRAIELAPDTATADLAQQNISLLEVGPRLR
ncbi:MAG: tetratricopeptide repeat protein [Acetobacteraceae bacterium]|nr:tetratricopeptide repeat protein [Acetobacteraceae bacterium]MSP29073.1 tetratricopeptide repeat protein [Acetobacteraceae bacterium]